MTSAAKFYAEDLGTNLEIGEKIANFMDLALKNDVVESARTWAKHGKIRVYIEFYSQNNRSPIIGMESCYYDALKNDVVITINQYGFFTKKLSEIRGLSNSSFSGAKTREAIYRFSEAFYG